MNKKERKMTKEQLEGLLHTRHRNAVHKPKKGKGSFNRQKEKRVDE